MVNDGLHEQFTLLRESIEQVLPKNIYAGSGRQSRLSASPYTAGCEQHMRLLNSAKLAVESDGTNWFFLAISNPQLIQVI